MLKKTYIWTLALANHRLALWALAFISFLESSVFPIPPDILMIPMIVARPNRAFLIATVVLFASVLGGLLGYAIGALFYDQIGFPLLSFFGKAELASQFNSHFNDLGFWPILIAGLTPLPYKIITIVSGWSAVPLTTFVITSIVSRGLRFFLVATLLWYYGEAIDMFIRKKLGLIFIVFILVLISGFGFIKIL
jgi:membrane protein YqaA with SNARE-associated domain